MAKLFLSLLLVQMDPARGMAFPVPAVAAAVVAPVFGMLGFRRAQRQSDAFFSMDWSQDVSDNGDACVIVGEETAPNGKIWCGACFVRSALSLIPLSASRLSAGWCAMSQRRIQTQTACRCLAIIPTGTLTTISGSASNPSPELETAQEWEYPSARGAHDDPPATGARAYRPAQPAYVSVDCARAQVAPSPRACPRACTPCPCIMLRCGACRRAARRPASRYAPRGRTRAREFPLE